MSTPRFVSVRVLDVVLASLVALHLGCASSTSPGKVVDAGDSGHDDEDASADSGRDAEPPDASGADASGSDASSDGAAADATNDATMSGCDGACPIDECDAETDDCHDVTEVCVDTTIGFECVCGPGFSDEGGACVDIDECEEEDCSGHGTCVNASGSYSCSCSPGYTSDGMGECVLSNECQAGVLPDHKWCSGQCVDITQDANHCGDCGVSCGDGMCVAGDCACPSNGESFCPGAGCVDVANDPMHCGACDNECASNGGFCVGAACNCPPNTVECLGACVPTNAATVCGDECVNTASDTAHCGQCDNGCAQGAYCLQGACACPGGQVVCDDACTRQTSPENCVTCGRTCSVACGLNGPCVVAVEIESGGAFTCARLSDGSVRCWGANDRAQARRNWPDDQDYGTPEPYGLEDVTDFAVGSRHACVIATDQRLYCWGDNAFNQVDFLNSPSPAVAQLEPFLTASFNRVALGDRHSCAQRTTGEIVCWGDSSLGQRGCLTTMCLTATFSGPGLSTLSNVDKLVSGANHVCALKAGLVYCWGTLNVTFDGGAPGVAIGGLSGVDDIDAGGRHVCAVVDGSVYCWGHGDRGQLGNGSSAFTGTPALVPGIANAVSVHAGGDSTCVKRADNSVTCWGANDAGQLGNGTFTSTNIANATLTGGASLTGISLGGAHACALAPSGEVSCWGSGSDLQTTFNANASVPQNIAW